MVFKISDVCYSLAPHMCYVHIAGGYNKEGGIIRRGVVFLLKNIDWEVVSRWGVNAH